MGRIQYLNGTAQSRQLDCDLGYENLGFGGRAASRLPEEVMLTEQCWDLLLTEILTPMKPYLDIETKVLIEQTIFLTSRENKETMSSYLMRKTNKHRELSVN